ncbi:MAG: hypothetical protein AABX51_00495 [Nanoarchaeota archaeon]
MTLNHAAFLQDSLGQTLLDDAYSRRRLGNLRRTQTENSTLAEKIKSGISTIKKAITHPVAKPSLEDIIHILDPHSKSEKNFLKFNVINGIMGEAYRLAWTVAAYSTTHEFLAVFGARNHLGMPMQVPNYIVGYDTLKEGNETDTAFMGRYLEYKLIEGSLFGRAIGTAFGAATVGLYYLLRTQGVDEDVALGTSLYAFYPAKIARYLCVSRPIYKNLEPNSEAVVDRIHDEAAKAVRMESFKRRDEMLFHMDRTIFM